MDIGRVCCRVCPQKPHATAAYTFRPGFWASVGYAYDYGGESEVNGIKKDNRQQNVAWAASIAYPLSRRAGAKFSYVETETRESTGLDSQSLALAFSVRF